MNTTVTTVIPQPTSITGRDRAILTAVAAGRCAVGAGAGGALLIDGRCCSDQFAGGRLRSAGLIRVVEQTAELTPLAVAVLAAA